MFIRLHSNMYKRSYKLQILSHTQNTSRHQFTNIGSDLRILQVFLSCHRVLLHLLQDLLHHRIRKDTLKTVSDQTGSILLSYLNFGVLCSSLENFFLWFFSTGSRVHGTVSLCQLLLNFTAALSIFIVFLSQFEGINRFSEFSLYKLSSSLTNITTYFLNMSEHCLF